MRIDKFLKNARIIKRRTVAKAACDTNRVKVNDKICKAGYELSVGDKVSIEFGQKTLNIEVLELIDSSKKDVSEKMFRILED